jgi:hypothetical protein
MFEPTKIIDERRNPNFIADEDYATLKKPLSESKNTPCAGA